MDSSNSISIEVYWVVFVLLGLRAVMTLLQVFALQEHARRTRQQWHPQELRDLQDDVYLDFAFLRFLFGGIRDNDSPFYVSCSSMRFIRTRSRKGRTAISFRSPLLYAESICT